MSTNLENRPRQVAFPTRRRSGLVGNYTTTQLLMMVAAFLLVAVAVFANNGDLLTALQITFLPAVGLFTLGVWNDPYGYPIVDQVGLRGRFLFRKALGQTRYRKPLRTRIGLSGKLHLPGGLAALSIFDGEAGEKDGAIIEDATNGVFSCVLRVTTPGYGLLDGPEQRERVDAWALFQSGLVKQTGLARIQVLTVTSVASPTAVRDHYEANTSHKVSEWGRQQYETLLDYGVANSPRQEQFITVVLDRARLGKDIKAQGGGRAGLLSVMKRQVAALTVSLAEADVTVTEWLNTRQVSAVLRRAYDPASGELIDGRSLDWAGVAPSSAAPMAGDESWDHLQTDSAYHQTFEITEWPRIPTTPDFLDAVTTLPFPVALSLYFTPVPLKLSLRRIKLERGKIDSNREMRHRRGNFREDSAFEVREREDVNERERELVQGFGDLEFLGLVTVTASTEDELLANVSQMRSAMEGRAMEVRSMNGQQLAAFNCGRLPLALAPASSGKNPLGA